MQDTNAYVAVQFHGGILPHPDKGQRMVDDITRYVKAARAMGIPNDEISLDLRDHYGPRGFAASIGARESGEVTSARPPRALTTVGHFNDVKIF